MARNIDDASPSSDGMLRLRPLGCGHWLVQLDTSLGPLTLLVSDRAAMGNLYVWLNAALIQRLADNLLGIVARTTRASAEVARVWRCIVCGRAGGPMDGKGHR